MFTAWYGLNKTDYVSSLTCYKIFKGPESYMAKNSNIPKTETDVTFAQVHKTKCNNVQLQGNKKHSTHAISQNVNFRQ